MTRLNKYRLILCLIVISIIGSLLPAIVLPQRADAFYWPWEDTDCTPVVKNGAVTVDNDIVWMEAKPDILKNSGWVEFSFITKRYSGKIDVVYGFNGIDGVHAVETEDQSGKKWNKSAKVNNRGRSDGVEWQTSSNNKYINKNKKHTIRVWIDVPIKLGKVEGKYVIGIKPSTSTIEQAMVDGDLFLIDPWYDVTWNYRKTLTINNAGAALADYQLPINVYYGAGVDSGQDVYVGGNCQTDFDDIRFTESDGETLLYEWREQYVVSDNSTFWVNFQTVGGAGATTYYIYYGNTTAIYPYMATDKAHGDAVFTYFDDFERGNNGDPIGGTWAITSGDVDISTEQDLGDLGNYYGTRSMKLLGNVAVSIATTAVVQGDNVSIRYQIYKEDLASTTFGHGDGTDLLFTRVFADEKIQWFDGLVFQDTGFSVTADSWDILGYHDFVWGALTVDIFLNDGKIENDADISYPSALYNDQIAPTGDAVAGVDTYYDNVMAYAYRETDTPAITVWGSEETAAQLLTLFCTGFNRVWAILNSSLIGGSAGGTVNQRGFQYGLTPSYGDNVTAYNVSLGDHRLLIPNLEPATQYHYRAFVEFGGAYQYGIDRTFSTKGKPTLYENFTGSNADRDIYESNWAYQTFSTDNVSNAAHSVSEVWLRLQRVGTLVGDLEVSIRNAAGGEPTGPDLTSGTLDGAIISENVTGYSWYQVEMDEEVYLSDNVSYAVVLQAPSDNATHFVQWQYEDTGGYDMGQAGFSQNNGYSWNVTSYDQLFEIWGNPAILVYSAKVFTGYLEDGDWLIPCHYKNLYPPYFEDGRDVSQLFYLQLTDNVTARAQTLVPRWEESPGSIYLSAEEVQSLEWGKEYTVRMYGNFGDNPYMEYMLQIDDWIGDDLTRLDSYVFDVNQLLSDYYGVPLLTAVAGKGDVLNDVAAAIFIEGIPGLNEIRPHLFENVTQFPVNPDEDFDQGYQDTLVWQEMFGPGITLSMTNLGNVFSLSGQMMGMIIIFLVFAMFASVGFAPGHGIAGMALSFPVILAGAYTGLVQLVVLGVICALASFVLIWQYVIRGG